MKSRNDRLGYGQSADQLLNSLSHFSGSFVGEGHGENRLRHGPYALDQMSNAVSDDARLPAARTSQNEHRPVSGFDRLTLLRIEFREKRQLKDCSRSSVIKFYRTRRIANGNGTQGAAPNVISLASQGGVLSFNPSGRSVL